MLHHIWDHRGHEPNSRSDDEKGTEQFSHMMVYRNNLRRTRRVGGDNRSGVHERELRVRVSLLLCVSTEPGTKSEKLAPLPIAHRTGTGE